MPAAHRHSEYATRAELRELATDVRRLRERVITLEAEVRMMHVLQAAARTLLGLPPRPMGDDSP